MPAPRPSDAGPSAELHVFRRQSGLIARVSEMIESSSKWKGCRRWPRELCKRRSRTTVAVAATGLMVGLIQCPLVKKQSMKMTCLCTCCSLAETTSSSLYVNGAEQTMFPAGVSNGDFCPATHPSPKGNIYRSQSVSENINDPVTKKRRNSIEL
jgi:hypothetical protein